jgi:antitoxin CptB
MTDALDIRRRKARFRSWHRGMREADLIMGGFADARMEALNEAQMAQYEQLLDVPDADLIRWMTGELPVPAAYDTPLFRQIASFAGAGRP